MPHNTCANTCANLSYTMIKLKLVSHESVKKHVYGSILVSNFLFVTIQFLLFLLLVRTKLVFSK